MALGAVLAAAAVRAAGERLPEHTLYGDVQVPLSRHYRGLGHAGITGLNALWPQGRVAYYIDTASGLERGDRRIRDAVRHWEQRTCIRFAHCTAGYSECPRPLVVFRKGTGCSSPVGLYHARSVNTITLAAGCGFGSTVHEIGHSLGLGHEHKRNDRDEYVEVVTSSIKPASRHNFHLAGEAGRSLGPYDYASVMHYWAGAFRKETWQTTIRAPQPIGQRNGLSAGDVRAIQFMYNGCRATYASPLCIASKSRDVHAIRRGVPFTVEMNVQYSSYTRVSYEDGDAPGARVTYSQDPDSWIWQAGRTTLAFTPTQADAGRTYTLAARFTRTDNQLGAASPYVVCSVRVRVEGTAVIAPATPVPQTPAPPTAAPPAPVGDVLSLKTYNGATVDAQAGVITDGYDRYTGNLDLAVTVTGKGCVLTWRELDIEYGSSCKYDSVQVEAPGGAVLAKACGSILEDHPPFMAADGFTVRFTSDSSQVGAGFVLGFVCEAPAATPAPPTPLPTTEVPLVPATAAPRTPLPTTEAPIPTPRPSANTAAPPAPVGNVISLKTYNGATVDAQAGVITDGYDRYTGNLDLAVTVTGKGCVLTWRELDIEYGSSCKYDSVQVEAPGGAVLAKACGSILEDHPPFMAADGFTVRFTSDSSQVGAGFVLGFVCEAPAATPAPPTPLPTTEVPQTVTPQSPAPITATPQTPAPTTAVPQTPTPTTATPQTPAPTTAVPQTPAPTTAGAVNVALSIKEDGGRTVAAQSGAITDGWVGDYDLSVDKAVTVLGTGCTLKWTFIDIEDYGCKYDYVEIVAGGAATKHCGRGLPPSQRLPGDRFTIRFVSDSSQAFEGFRVEFACDQ
eukprot:TRINITY_DN4492_c0_g1_i2.p1 TRINITY_DN4492_c0_g1~~TRINITY_DN4492_c0_g1_i2.p1  ORF type:complete len:846 (+),score=228.08 TRINITY_DN4492_c0_g1_i2:72-2609(+)